MRHATVALLFALAGCSSIERATHAADTAARATDGSYISWREHLIDDATTGGPELQGGDGIVMADLDKDGYLDIVSVHESDTEYDGTPDGLIRIAFGSADPDKWVNVTLASGKEAAAPEDVAVADVNGDGWLDIAGACELAHVIYFQNPGRDVRGGKWPRVIPAATNNRGSYIRVFFADLNGDGRPELMTPNKGAQAPTRTQPTSAISYFEVKGDPLQADSWTEHELGRAIWPINSQPIDIDADGDIDVLGGSVAEAKIIWFENDGRGNFSPHPLETEGSGVAGGRVSGFNMDFADLSGDGKLDILTFEFTTLVGRAVVWLEQPAQKSGKWNLHVIGDYAPDQVVGLAFADINGDGRQDVMTGGYSAGARAADKQAKANQPAGRLVWYENSGPNQARDPRWTTHEISRRQRGMFDKFWPRDMDGDGDLDFVTTRGNSSQYDGVLWLEQVRTKDPAPAFVKARTEDSPEVPLP